MNESPKDTDPWDVPGAGQPPDYLPYKCEQCERSWKSEQARRMHIARAHGNMRGQPRTMGGGRWSINQPKEERLRLRREYQRNLRERNYAKGLTSKGTARRYPVQAKSSRERYDQQKARYLAQGLNARGKPLKGKKSYSQTLTGDRREAYLAKQRKYHKELYARRKDAEKRIQIVYNAQEAQTATQQLIQGIHYCPYCGSNIEKHITT